MIYYNFCFRATIKKIGVNWAENINKNRVKIGVKLNYKKVDDFFHFLA